MTLYNEEDDDLDGLEDLDYLHEKSSGNQKWNHLRIDLFTLKSSFMKKLSMKNIE